MRVDGDDRPFDLRDLAQHIGGGSGIGVVLLAGRYFDRHHIAGFEHLIGPPDRRPKLLLGLPLARPSELRKRDMSVLAGGKADLRRRRRDGKNDRPLPVAKPRGGVEVFEGLLPFGARIDPGQRSPPAVPAVVGGKFLAERFPGDLLESRIEGGAYRQPALVEAFLAALRQQFTPHFFGEEVCLDKFRLGPPAHDKRRRQRIVGLDLGDEPLFEHARDHPVAA